MRGRPAGSRNRLTLETLALVGEGETPVAYLLGIMRDTDKPQDVRLQAAKFAAPPHSKSSVVQARRSLSGGARINLSMRGACPLPRPSAAPSIRS
jgi:hypothetical protein